MSIKHLVANGGECLGFTLSQTSKGNARSLTLDIFRQLERSGFLRGEGSALVIADGEINAPDGGSEDF